MKLSRFYIAIPALLLASALSLQAQSETDAFRLSQTGLAGSARYQALAGAFTALGGDLSAIAYNPAATAVFHNSEFLYTMNVNSRNVNAQWFDREATNKKSGFHSGQVGIVASFFDRSSDNSFNFAFNMNQSYLYNRGVSIASGRPTDYSLADYTAACTPDGMAKDDFWPRNGYDPYNTPASWLAVLGYQSGWTSAKQDAYGPYYASAYEYYDQSQGKYLPYGPANSKLQFSESGCSRNYDFSFGFNFKDLIYTGFSLKYVTTSMRYQSEYNESFPFNDYLNLRNQLFTRGDGFAFSVGMIGRPTDGFRLGFALESPTFYRLTDRFDAAGSSRYSQGVDKDGKLLPEKEWYYDAQTPQNAYYVYNLMTPMKASLGIAYTYKNYGLISLDYSVTPYRMMHLSDDEGPLSSDNNAISKHYLAAHTFRAGVEVKPISRLAIRLGYMVQTAPSKDIDAMGKTNSEGGSIVAVSGTIPHFEMKRGLSAVTCGLGGYITKRFYTDLALVWSNQKSKVYTFPTIYNNSGNAVVTAPESINLRQRDFTATLSLGVKF